MTRPPTPEEFSAWLEGYKRAWESRNLERVGTLFTEGATYKDSRFYPAIEGRANIIDFWRERIVTREVIAFSYEAMGSFEGMGLCRWQTSLLDFSDHENLKYEGQS